jgi:hypothetical protein
MLLFIASSLSRPRFCLVVTPTRGLKSFQTRPVSRHSSVRIHRHYYALIILSCSFCRALTYKSWILSTAPFVEHRSISLSVTIPKGMDSIHQLWILSIAPVVEHRSMSSSVIIPKGMDSIHQLWILSTAPFVEHRSVSSSVTIPNGKDSIHQLWILSTAPFVEHENTDFGMNSSSNCGFYLPLHLSSKNITNRGMDSIHTLTFWAAPASTDVYYIYESTA